MKNIKRVPEKSVLLDVVPSPDGVSGTTWARLRYHAQSVADVHNVHIRDLLGTGREKRVVRARAHLYKHARDMGLSYPRIGKIFGRDHTTIMHALDSFFGDLSRVNSGIDIVKGASYNAPLSDEVNDDGAMAEGRRDKVHGVGRG